VDAVKQALKEAETLNLANDFSDSQHWYDEYGSITEECEDYAELFPDDEEIPRIDELLQVIEDYPQIDDQPDEERDFSSLRSSSSSADDDIQQIFSDL